MVKELRQGCTDAFEALFKKYGKHLYFFGLGHLKSEVEAQGLVQDTFAKIWEKRTDIRIGLSFKSYIFTIAFNIIRKTFIKRKRFKDFLEAESTKSELDLGTQDRVNYTFLKERIDVLVEQMPEKRREIFVKSRIEGLSNQEIAKKMGISTKTVANQMTSALKFLRDNLGKSITLLTTILPFSL